MTWLCSSSHNLLLPVHLHNPGRMFTLVILSVLLLIGSISAGDEDPLVETPLGKLRGTTLTSRSGETFMAFLGIPYAKPPVGELRFQPPVPISSWEGIKEAKEDGPFCIQFSILFTKTPSQVGVEDCLYLHVYTRNVSGKAPVLVHFHGGGFTMGNSKYAQPHFLIDEDIVIVNVNYRVGIFGFLSFETPEMPGNQGMKDQVMSLHWVQENIASFGGDPNQVTIIGESAGAGSVYHHIVSPLSKGLFHQGVAQSGSSFAPWALAPPGFPRSRAEKLMTLLGCPTEPKEAIPCVMKADPNQVVLKMPDFLEWQIDPLLNFGPALEPAGPNAFLVGPISEWKPNPVPLYIGMCSAEGLFRTMMLLEDPASFKDLVSNFDRLAPTLLMYFATATQPDQITKEIRKFYFPNKEEITMNDWVPLTKIFSAALGSIGIMDAADFHTGKVYFYLFDYVSKANIPPGAESFMIGAGHASDVFFYWNVTNPSYLIRMNSDDVELSKKLVKRLANFIKIGTPDLEENGFEWKPWTREHHYYLHIDRKAKFHLKEGLEEETRKFWHSINYRDKFDTETGTCLNVKNHENNCRDKFDTETGTCLNVKNHENNCRDKVNKQT